MFTDLPKSTPLFLHIFMAALLFLFNILYFFPSMPPLHFAATEIQSIRVIRHIPSIFSLLQVLLYACYRAKCRGSDIDERGGLGKNNMVEKAVATYDVSPTKPDDGFVSQPLHVPR